MKLSNCSRIFRIEIFFSLLKAAVAAAAAAATAAAAAGDARAVIPVTIEVLPQRPIIDGNFSEINSELPTELPIRLALTLKGLWLCFSPEVNFQLLLYSFDSEQSVETARFYYQPGRNFDWKGHQAGHITIAGNQTGVEAMLELQPSSEPDSPICGYYIILEIFSPHNQKYRLDFPRFKQLLVD